MSPTPRPRFKPMSDNPGRSFPSRLDVLTILVIVQIILSIMIWAKIPKVISTEPESAHQVIKKADNKTDKPILDDLSQSRTDAVQPEKRTAATIDDDLTENIGAPKTLKLQVLNGTNVPKLGAKLVDFLEDNGYDVLDVGNADRSDYAATQVMNRTGKKAETRKIASIIGIAPSNVLDSNPSKSVDVDITIIIGKDYKRFDFAK